MAAPTPPTIPSPVGSSVYNALVAVPVGMWTGNWTGAMAPIARTDLAAMQYRGFVQDNSWEFTLPFDSTDSAVAAGFVFGTVISELAFALGSGGKCDLLYNTTVEKVTRNMNADGTQPISVTVSGKGGSLTLNTPLPTS